MGGEGEKLGIIKEPYP